MVVEPEDACGELKGSVDLRGKVRGQEPCRRVFSCCVDVSWLSMYIFVGGGVGMVIYGCRWTTGRT